MQLSPEPSDRINPVSTMTSNCEVNEKSVTEGYFNPKIFIFVVEISFGKDIMEQDNEIIIYQNEEGDTRIEVKYADETAWLSQNRWRRYGTTRPNIVQHIHNIF